MSALQTTVLTAGTALLAVSSAVIVWREMSSSAEGRFLRSWRDYLGLATTIGGLVVLLTWLWSTR